ncbi:hypothetical protein [Pseudodesulfovibrio sp. zrk46]|uniref:hypothetical protein n=1 Tax=Pseudodesulfovibrio sp. zrk46 TaxID=2725288 RepID=UPI001FFD860E|nr:hypothetical protein [Pseudodesulfovibrio sp. zrk46]
MGDAGGDDDWYGYCLDDPVNGVDPLGLFAFLLPFAAGMAGVAKAIPTTAATVMRNPDKLAAGSKSAVDFASGAFDPGPPPLSWFGFWGNGARKAYDEYDDFKKRK